MNVSWYLYDKVKAQLRDFAVTLGMKDKERQILDAAEKAFAENGFKEASTRQIAQLAGVNASMLNYYFQSKEKLLEAVLARKIVFFEQMWNELAVRHVVAIDRLNALLHLNIKLIKGNSSFFRFILREQLISSAGDAAPIIRNYFKHRLNTVKDILVYGVEQKEFKPVDIELVTLSITGTYISCLLNPDFVEEDSMYDRITNYFERYIRNILL